MSKQSNNPFRFWQELKRRKVFRVIAMYTGTAFIIMEAGDIMLPRLGFPDWTVTFIIILLIIGFPISIILSWIFDLTPEGVKKTESASLAKVKVPEGTNRRRLNVSDVIIAVLVIVVGVMAYPKVFKSPKFEEIRDADGRISIAVMPFKNLAADTLLNIWQEGLQNLLITSLSNSKELSVRQYEIMEKALGIEGSNYAAYTQSLAKETALKLDANIVILGNIHKSGNIIRITANLIKSNSEEIYKSYELEGNTEHDIFNMTDSLSALIRNYLEIKSLENKFPIGLKTAFTNSAEAYKCYIQGSNYHGQLNYSAAIAQYTKAIEIDSSFISPMLMLAYCLGDIGQSEESKKWAYKAYSHIENVPLSVQLQIMEIKSAIEKKPLEQIKYMNQYLDFDPYSTRKMYAIGWANYNICRWQNAIEAFEKGIELNKQYEKNYKLWIWYYALLGNAYHNIGEYKKGNRVYEDGLNLWPDDPNIIYRQAIYTISKGDTIGSKKYLSDLLSIAEKNNWSKSTTLFWIGNVYEKAEEIKKAEEYYRKAITLMDTEDTSIINHFAYFLIFNDININEGMKLINHVLELCPNNGDNLFTYGFGLYKQGKLKKSEEILTRAWDLIPYYNYDYYLLIKEVKQALAIQNSEQ